MGKVNKMTKEGTKETSQWTSNTNITKILLKPFSLDSGSESTSGSEEKVSIPNISEFTLHSIMVLPLEIFPT